MIDKRSNRRFGPLVIKAQIDDASGLVEGYLTNVSEGGAFFAMDHPPAIGTEVSLRAALPWALGELRASAQVVWRQPPDTGATEDGTIVGVGVAFTKLDEESKDILERYLARFAELAAQLDDSAPAPLHDAD